LLTQRGDCKDRFALRSCCDYFADLLAVRSGVRGRFWGLPHQAGTEGT